MTDYKVRCSLALQHWRQGKPITILDLVRTQLICRDDIRVSWWPVWPISSISIKHVNHSILLAILSNIGITGKAHSWFESYLAGRLFNGSRSHICTSPPCHRDAPRIGPRPLPLCHVYLCFGPDHPLTWLFISLLCSWYPAISVIPTWWLNRLNTNLESQMFFFMDEGPSPLAKPVKNWISGLLHQANCTS